MLAADYTGIPGCLSSITTFQEILAVISLSLLSAYLVLTKINKLKYIKFKRSLKFNFTSKWG